MLFPSFTHHSTRTKGAEINFRRGGTGAPVLLLHGYPQTHLCWHLVAPALAKRFTVICADLRGYGDSSKPASDPEHAAYSKRSMAQDMVELMAEEGFSQFAVVGHDRGGRVAYRMALDHPATVTKLAVLDIVPTHAMWTKLDKKLATSIYHWLFLIQPHGLPEAMIGADPGYFLREKLRSWASNRDCFSPDVVAEYARCFSMPETIHATCEDYRAGAGIDFILDEADFGKRKIACPVLALWGAKGIANEVMDVLGTWQQWAEDVRGQVIPCGHFLPEEAPVETVAALEAFL